MKGGMHMYAKSNSIVYAQNKRITSKVTLDKLKDLGRMNLVSDDGMQAKDLSLQEAVSYIQTGQVPVGWHLMSKDVVL